LEQLLAPPTITFVQSLDMPSSLGRCSIENASVFLIGGSNRVQWRFLYKMQVACNKVWEKLAEERLRWNSMFIDALFYIT